MSTEQSDEKSSRTRSKTRPERSSPRKGIVGDEASAATHTPWTDDDAPSSRMVNNALRLLTPHLSPSPVASSSALSSPKTGSLRSFQVSDADSMPGDMSSQAIMSSEDEDDDAPSEVQDSSPQLVMPSIKMPSRRPFTERGKTMGRFKVLIAGASGTIVTFYFHCLDCR